MTVSCVLAGVAAAVLAIVVLDVTGALNARLEGLITLVGLLAAGVIAYRLVSPRSPRRCWMSRS